MQTLSANKKKAPQFVIHKACNVSFKNSLFQTASNTEIWLLFYGGRFSKQTVLYMLVHSLSIADIWTFDLNKDKYLIMIASIIYGINTNKEQTKNPVSSKMPWPTCLIVVWFRIGLKRKHWCYGRDKRWFTSQCPIVCRCLWSPTCTLFSDLACSVQQWNISPVRLWNKLKAHVFRRLFINHHGVA